MKKKLRSGKRILQESESESCLKESESDSEEHVFKRLVLYKKKNGRRNEKRKNIKVG